MGLPWLAREIPDFSITTDHQHFSGYQDITVITSHKKILL